MYYGVLVGFFEFYIPQGLVGHEMTMTKLPTNFVIKMTNLPKLSFESLIT